jgi:hypothetical protein
MSKVMKKINIIYKLLLVVSTSLLLGCGGGGGGSSSSGGSGDNPITPEPDLPTEYVQYSFNKQPNEIQNIPTNSDNVAIDIPVGSTYFVSITNTSSDYQSISLVSSVGASLRVSVNDEPQANQQIESLGSFFRQERDEAELRYRLNFINHLKQRRNTKVLRSIRAGFSGVDHSYEEKGGLYNVWVSDTNGKPYCLNNCKLVAVTDHAKFFVDQNDRFGYSSHKDFMESVVKDGAFSFENVFDKDTVNIYKLMLDNFGDYINGDVDHDGKISVIITPYLTKIGVDGGYGSGLRGLFMYYCMLEDFVDTQGITQSRDLIILAPPLGGKEVETDKNRAEALTNLCHEYQHLLNFIQRFYRNGVYSFTDDDSNKYFYELGFDEGCSVCAEALFRRARGKRGYQTLYDYKTLGPSSLEYTGNDWYDRFNSVNFTNVFPFNPFHSENYGRNGLFMLYLHDRFGKENFKKLIQLPFTGNDLKKVIPQTLGTSESLDELQRDWHFALQHQYLMTEQNNKGEEMTTNVRYRYGENEDIEWLKLNSLNKKLNTGKISLSAGNTLFYKIKPDSANSGSNFRFFIKSLGKSVNKNLDINIIML